MKQVPQRGKGRYTNCITVKDQYAEYHKKNVNTPFDVDYKLFKQIVGDFNLKIIDHILKDNGEFKIPYRLGKITIVKKKLNFDKPNRLPIDWKLSKEIGQIVRRTNEHTNEYKYSIKWEKKNSIVKNKSLYSFIPTRTFSRALASEILNNNMDYFA